MLARELHFAYLDTGAMYRCVALLSLQRPGEEPAALARTARIDLTEAGSGSPAAVLLEARDVSEEIRAPEVSERASQVASIPAVREAMVVKQRELISAGDWVAEGRDIGTVVAPDAELKIFLTADARERARRRATQLGADVATVLAEQTMRDERDTKREHSPLRPAPGAVVLDTSGLDVAQVVARIAELAHTARRPA
jgi:cytidylate kinase